MSTVNTKTWVKFKNDYWVKLRKNLVIVTGTLVWFQNYFKCYIVVYIIPTRNHLSTRVIHKIFGKSFRLYVK